MAISPQGVLRAAGPLARAAGVAVQHPLVRAAADRALRRVDAVRPAAGAPRHPLSPAAVRVERARSRRGDERSDLTAVTVWFGQGPSLPSAGGDTLRTAARIGSTVLGAVAFAALTAVAARREESRTRVVEGSAREPRLG